MDIEILPILSDNYAYILRADSGAVAVIDPGEAAPVLDALEARYNGRCDYVLNTHHHWDHTNGNAEILERTGATLIAPENVGEVFDFDGHEAHILRTPGHTLDAICFYFTGENALFTGDTLFSMGCGRLFEGTAAQMWDSFQKIMALPDETRIYCGHEYTQANGGFCLQVEPDNTALQARMKEVLALRSKNLPTIPVTLGMEKKTNVFLRAGSAEKFAELRQLKDRS